MHINSFGSHAFVSLPIYFMNMYIINISVTQFSCQHGIREPVRPNEKANSKKSEFIPQPWRANVDSTRCVLDSSHISETINPSPQPNLSDIVLNLYVQTKSVNGDNDITPFLSFLIRMHSSSSSTNRTNNGPIQIAKVVWEEGGSLDTRPNYQLIDSEDRRLSGALTSVHMQELGDDLLIFCFFFIVYAVCKFAVVVSEWKIFSNIQWFGFVSSKAEAQIIKQQNS